MGLFPGGIAHLRAHVDVAIGGEDAEHRLLAVRVDIPRGKGLLSALGGGGGLFRHGWCARGVRRPVGNLAVKPHGRPGSDSPRRKSSWTRRGLRFRRPIPRARAKQFKCSLSRRPRQAPVRARRTTPPHAALHVAPRGSRPHRERHRHRGGHHARRRHRQGASAKVREPARATDDDTAGLLSPPPAPFLDADVAPPSRAFPQRLNETGADVARLSFPRLPQRRKTLVDGFSSVSIPTSSVKNSPKIKSTRSRVGFSPL